MKLGRRIQRKQALESQRFCISSESVPTAPFEEIGNSSTKLQHFVSESITIRDRESFRESEIDCSNNLSVRIIQGVFLQVPKSYLLRVRVQIDWFPHVNRFPQS